MITAPFGERVEGFVSFVTKMLEKVVLVLNSTFPTPRVPSFIGFPFSAFFAQAT